MSRRLGEGGKGMSYSRYENEGAYCSGEGGEKPAPTVTSVLSYNYITEGEGEKKKSEEIANGITKKTEEPSLFTAVFQRWFPH